MYDLYNIGPSTFNYGPSKDKSLIRSLDTFKPLRNKYLKRLRVVSYTRGDGIYPSYIDPLVNEFVSSYKRASYNGKQRCLTQVYLTEMLTMKKSWIVSRENYVTSSRVTYAVIDNKDIWLDLIRLDRMKFCR